MTSRPMTSAAPRRRAHFPLGQLRRVLRGVYNEFFDDSIPTVAAGVTFFFLLALFPAIACVVSLLRMFADAGELHRDLNIVSGFLPGGAVSVLRDELHRLVAQKPGEINLSFFIAFSIALWSASGGFKALVDALNVAYEVKDRRGFLRQTGNALIFAAAAILFAIVAVNLGVVIPAWALKSDADFWVRLLVQILAWPFSFLMGSVLVALIYRFGPDRRDYFNGRAGRPSLRSGFRSLPKWRWITWGSATASFLWLMGTLLFTWYVEHFGTYNQVYGNLGAIVGFLTWVWLSIVVLLLGAEIDCELQQRDAA